MVNREHPGHPAFESLTNETSYRAKHWIYVEINSKHCLSIYVTMAFMFIC